MMRTGRWNRIPSPWRGVFCDKSHRSHPIPIERETERCRTAWIAWREGVCWGEEQFCMRHHLHLGRAIFCPPSFSICDSDVGDGNSEAGDLEEIDSLLNTPSGGRRRRCDCLAPTRLRLAMILCDLFRPLSASGWIVYCFLFFFVIFFVTRCARTHNHTNISIGTMYLLGQ